ncbi:MAG: carbohydrate porin [Planctomycetia bacterium]|nr:carbohydrate porin [Planctomycetia bacterium]
MRSRSRFAHSFVRMLLAVSTVAATALAQMPSDDPSILATQPVPPPPPPPPPPLPSPFGGSLLERPKLTGDWFGTRTELAEDGVTLDVSNTQYYQGVTSGGLEQSFQYGGRNDYFMNLNGEKVGLWKGLFVTLHGETRYGESANSLTGALMPVNLMLAVPQPNGSVSALTDVKFTQFLSENMLVYAGKINTVDGFKQPITGAGGLNGFTNTAMTINPVYARTVPYSTFGAGFAYLQNMEPVFAAAVFDTNNTPTVSGFDTFFDNGATVFAQLNLPTTFFDRPGHQGISGTYSSGTYPNISPTAYLNPGQGLVIVSAPQTGSYCLVYNFDQAVYVSPENPQRKWGVFGNLGIADNNPARSAGSRAPALAEPARSQDAIKTHSGWATSSWVSARN